jgi:hypothetical protein
MARTFPTCTSPSHLLKYHRSQMFKQSTSAFKELCTVHRAGQFFMRLCSAHALVEAGWRAYNPLRNFAAGCDIFKKRVISSRCVTSL